MRFEYREFIHAKRKKYAYYLGNNQSKHVIFMQVRKYPQKRWKQRQAQRSIERAHKHKAHWALFLANTVYELVE